MVDLSREEIEKFSKVQMLCSVEVDSQEKLYQLSKIDGKFRWCFYTFNSAIAGKKYLTLLVNNGKVLGVGEVLESKQRADSSCLKRNGEFQGFYKFNRLWKTVIELDIKLIENSLSCSRSGQKKVSEDKYEKLFCLLKDNLELIPE